jgi:prevent-host-death family protein
MADDTWSLAEAKAKFSEVAERARTKGPQHVTRNGKPAVVVVAEDDWARASGGDKSFADVLFNPAVRGLLSDEEVDALFARDPDIGRPVGL